VRLKISIVSLKSDSKWLHFVSSPCDASGECADVSDEHPSDGAGDRRFEILDEAATTSEPREGPLDNPTAGERLEAFGDVRTFDDPQRPRAFTFQRGARLVAGVTAVGEDMTQLKNPTSAG